MSESSIESPYPMPYPPAPDLAPTCSIPISVIRPPTVDRRAVGLRRKGFLVSFDSWDVHQMWVHLRRFLKQIMPNDTREISSLHLASISTYSRMFQ